MAYCSLLFREHKETPRGNSLPVLSRGRHLNPHKKKKQKKTEKAATVALFLEQEFPYFPYSLMLILVRYYLARYL